MPLPFGHDLAQAVHAEVATQSFRMNLNSIQTDYSDRRNASVQFASCLYFASALCKYSLNKPSIDSPIFPVVNDSLTGLGYTLIHWHVQDVGCPKMIGYPSWPLE